MKDDQTFLLSPSSVLYIESVDKKTFIYCQKEVYETPLRLYELEEETGKRGQLSPRFFLYHSKEPQPYKVYCQVG